MCDWKAVSEEMKQMTGNKIRAEKHLGIFMAAGLGGSYVFWFMAPERCSGIIQGKRKRYSFIIPVVPWWDI
jgi:hypothetical protein